MELQMQLIGFPCFETKTDMKNINWDESRKGRALSSRLHFYVMLINKWTINKLFVLAWSNTDETFLAIHCVQQSHNAVQHLESFTTALLCDIRRRPDTSPRSAITPPATAWLRPLSSPRLCFVLVPPSKHLAVQQSIDFSRRQQTEG